MEYLESIWTWLECRAPYLRSIQFCTNRHWPLRVQVWYKVKRDRCYDTACHRYKFREENELKHLKYILFSKCSSLLIGCSNTDFRSKIIISTLKHVWLIWCSHHRCDIMMVTTDYYYPHWGYWTWPNPSIHLTHSKYGANPALTCIFFDPSWTDFFDSTG